MTTFKERLAIAAALMLMVGQEGFAQTTTTTTGGTTASAPAGSFDSLSPGNQKIARALFLAQKPTANGPAPLSLNQIAAMKGHEGWSQVFQQMKSEGLVQGKNLGQVVSGYEHSVHDGANTAHGGTTIVTKGDGRSYATKSTSSHSGQAHDADGALAGGHGHYADDVAAANAGGTTVTTGGGNHGESASVSASGGAIHGGGAAHGH